MKTLVLANQKGGVGKSAILTQLALYLRSLGVRVLVVDLDHQANTSRPLERHGGATRAAFTASEVFETRELVSPQDAPFVLVAADDRLSGLERQADQHNVFASRFRAFLASSTGFDICLIDTNPNPDIRYASALISADYVLAPVQLNQEALSGIAALFGHPRYGLGRIRASLNPSLVFLGILPNLVEATPFQKANLQRLIADYGARLLRRNEAGGVRYGHIQKRTAIAEAQATGVFLPDLGKTSARDTWREVKPVFDMILHHMDVAAPAEAAL